MAGRGGRGGDDRDTEGRAAPAPFLLRQRGALNQVTTLKFEN